MPLLRFDGLVISIFFFFFVVKPTLDTLFAFIFCACIHVRETLDEWSLCSLPQYSHWSTHVKDQVLTASPRRDTHKLQYL